MQPFLRIVEVDLRSLAWFRIMLGLLILFDLGTRATDLSAFYTDQGVLPRAALLDQFSNQWHVSVHFASGLAWVQAALFIVQALAAVALIVGFETRVAVVLSWFLQISLQIRNPMVLQAGDVLFRMILFWGMFLPLGARYSIDAALAEPDERPKSNVHRSVAGLALMLQVAYVYWFTYLQKTGDEWYPDGTAVYYALHIDIFATRFGVWLRQFPGVLHTLTLSTMAVEGYLPFLLFAPVLTMPLRLVAALAFMGMHAGFGLCMELGNFPWVDLVSFLPFIPGFAWDEIGAWRARRGDRFDFDSWLVRNLQLLPSWMRRHRPRLALRSPLWAPVTAAVLALVTIWNVTTVPSTKWTVSDRYRWIGSTLRLDQSWSMFAPFPLKDDGWFVIEGQTRGGKTVDVYHMTDTPPSFDKPAFVADEFPNQRWRKYMMNLWLASNKGHRLYYARWLCRTYNKERAEDAKVQAFKIFYMREDTLPDYKPSEVKKVEIWSHDCFKRVER